MLRMYDAIYSLQLLLLLCVLDRLGEGHAVHLSEAKFIIRTLIESQSRSAPNNGFRIGRRETTKKDFGL
jgi:hypothetical protein